MRKSGRIAKLGSAALGIDVGASSVEAVASAVQRLPRRNRSVLVQGTTGLLRGPSRRLESDRVAGAKLLVALLPESLDTITRLLKRRHDRWWYEFHFSLFCFLDFAQSFSPRVRESVYRVVKDYISSAASRTARAAWMAGDLLGDHWSGKYVADNLTELALTARYAAGREGALHGIEHRLQRADVEERAMLAKTLDTIAVSDRSRKVRSSARLTMRTAKAIPSSLNHPQNP